MVHMWNSVWVPVLTQCMTPKFKEKKCKECGELFMPFKSLQPVCTKNNYECSQIIAKRKIEKKLKADKNKEVKVEKTERKQKLDKFKKEAMTRTEWYNKLQDLINQWIVKVRDVDEPCCTCGTRSETIKYDAGHCFTRKARPDIRFVLTNIHKQCSVQCNQHGSGMRPEYEKYIVKKYGQEEWDWLKREKALLKDQFPHWTDIEKEIDRWRDILRDSGIRPKR